MNQPSNTVSVWVQALPQVPLQYWWYPWLLLLRRSSKSASDSASELLWEVRSLTIWNYCYFCRKPYGSPSRWHYHYFLQFEPGEFMAELQKQPQLVICSVEFLASREVHWKVLRSCGTWIALKHSKIVPISITSEDTWLQVKDILLDCNLSSPETRPIICIDECQVSNILKQSESEWI